MLLSPYGRVLHWDISMVCMITIVSHGFKINYHWFWIIWYTKMSTNVWKNHYDRNQSKPLVGDAIDLSEVSHQHPWHLISYISLNDSDIVWYSNHSFLGTNESYLLILPTDLDVQYLSVDLSAFTHLFEMLWVRFVAIFLRWIFN